MKKNSLNLPKLFFILFYFFMPFIVISCIDFGSIAKEIEPPQNLTVVGVYTDAIALSWTGNSSFSEYVVYVSATNDISQAQKIGVGDYTEVGIGGFTPLTTYYFWVAGVVYSSIGNPSDMVSATTLVGGPTSAKLEIDNNNLTVSFNKEPSAEGYNIYYNTNSAMDTDKKVSVSVDDLIYSSGNYIYKMSNYAPTNGLYFVWVTGTAPNSESSTFATAFARKGEPEYNFHIEELSSSQTINLETNGNNATLIKINHDDVPISDSKAGKVSSSVEKKSLFDYPLFYINGTQLPRGLIVDENDIANSSKVIRLDHQLSKEFTFSKSALSMAKKSRSLNQRSFSEFKSYDEGDVRSFWIDTTNSLGKTTFKRISATLQVVGEYGYIWVADSNYDNYSSSNSDNKLDKSQLEKLSDTFDKIFQAETTIFGKTYKEQYDEMYDWGLIEPEEKISILLFDIGSDYDANQSGGILGYFWSKDMIDDEYVNSSDSRYLRSNEAEIFYLDVHFLDKFENLALGTLPHEFQHMLHFVNKTIKLSDIEDIGASETWYNEMFSVLVEDLFAKELGVELSEMVEVYIKSFMAEYASKGLTFWNNDNLSYGYSYLLGAFVARNYGEGIEVVKEMASNEYFNIDLIVKAIQTVTDDDSFTEEDLFRDFTRALCYPEGMFGNITTVLNFDVEKETSIKELDPSSEINFDIYLEPIIFANYAFPAQNSDGQIFTVIGPYQYPRNNQYNSDSVICAKGFVLQDLGVYDESATFYYTKASNSKIKEYVVVQ